MSSIDEEIDCNFYDKIHSNNKDQYDFFDFIMECVDNNFVREYDVIVGDRAPYHTGGINKHLEDIMCDNYHILLIWLPARTPEWNPVELVWSLLQRRLGIIPLAFYKEHGKDSIAYLAGSILDRISYQDVYKSYIKCFF